MVAFLNVERASLSLSLVMYMMKGLKGNVYRVFEKKTSSISYRLEFPGKNNLLKFKNEIGFVNPKHLRKLNLYSEKMHMRWDGQQIFHC